MRESDHFPPGCRYEEGIRTSQSPLSCPEYGLEYLVHTIDIDSICFSTSLVLVLVGLVVKRALNKNAH